MNGRDSWVPLVDPKNAHSVPFEIHEERSRCCTKCIKLVGGCACAFQTDCPEHGLRCHGSHG